MYQRGFLFDVVRNHTRDDQHCDLKLLCGDAAAAAAAAAFNVHRFILYFQSDYFAKACDGKSLESPNQELTLDESSVLVDQMLKFFYEGAYSPQLDAASASRWLAERARALSSTGTGPATQTPPPLSSSPSPSSPPSSASSATSLALASCKGRPRLVDAAAAPPRVVTAVYHVAMFGLARRLAAPGLRQEALEATRAALRDLSTLEILEHVVPEVYASDTTAAAADDDDTDDQATREFRELVTGLLMDKLIYQTPPAEKARISSLNEALVDGFSAYAADLEQRILAREHEVSHMCAEMGIARS